MSERLNPIDMTDEDMNEIVYSLDTFETDCKQCLHWIEKLSLVSDQTKSEFNTEIEIICERFDYLITKWQTNPKLIECHLNQLLTNIIQIITNCRLNGEKFNACFQLIHRLASCIGPKSVSRYFPTEVLWLTKLIVWTEAQTSGEFKSWQTRSVLFLWLSMAVKTPFALKRFDSNDETIKEKTIIERIYDLIHKYLKVNDKCRDSATYLAANFFSRPDVVEQQLLSRFMNESLTILDTHFGHVMAVAILFKSSNRLDINPFAVKVIEIGTKLDTTNRELMSKWKIKLIGRSALSLMTPRIAKWRYRRGRRLLSQNISIQTSDPMQTDIGFEEKPFDDNEDDIDYSDIPEQSEVIIGSLMDGLHDPNTIVRWSAAKYVARLTNRLPKELASDVVKHVAQLCDWKGCDSWHGCCLALAELSRRGLILTEQLPQIIEVVQKALVFDEVKGSCSVGSNVRDAACYVCWSLSRAYESQVIEPFVHKLAPTLVCVTCFDREVNCRRAASAAIQEFVGRTQVFPHGLEVMVLTDFHSTSNRNHCYLDIALKLSQKPEFGSSLVEHLIGKCEHWDRDIREIVAQSLGLLSTVIDMNTYLPQLLSKSTTLDLNSRHGSISAIAYIIESFGHKMKPEFIEQMETIAITLNEKKFLRGIGGEFMKQSLSLLIGKTSKALLPIIASKEKVFDVWIEIVCDSISSEDIRTRSAAVSAVPSLCHNYLCNESLLKSRVLSQILKHLMSAKESARIGSSDSLVSMSIDVLDTDYYNKCFDILVLHINSGDPMCNSRASEVITLVQLSLKFRPICETKHKKIVECLCLALDDRTVDSRGDIGGNVRMAAIQAVLLFINESTDEEVMKFLKLITTQSVSVWKRERILAINAFKQIVFNRDLEAIDRQLIKNLFEESAEDMDQWKPFIQLLRVEVFTYDLWRGLVKCIANPTETRVRNLLKQELKSLKNHVFTEFLNLYEKYVFVDSLSQSLIDCSYFLLTSVRTDEEFRSKVLSQTWNCIRKVKDCRKLVSAIDVFCAGIQTGDYKKSTSYLVYLLCHSFPRIRSQTANQFYVSLLTVEDVSEEAINLLSETDWTQPLDQLRPIRDRVCDALNIPKPRRLTTGAISAKQ